MKYNPYRGIREMVRYSTHRKDVKRRMHRAFRRKAAYDAGSIAVHL